MGAFQNKAVEIIRAQSGEEKTAEHSLVRERLVVAMIELYRASGGSMDDLMNAARKKLDHQSHKDRIDGAMGELLQALALLGHLHDIDIIQAGYNTLDAQVRTLHQSHLTLK